MTEKDNALLPAQEAQTAITVSPEELSGVIAEIMRPLFQTIGKMLENNTAAMEQISAAQSVTNDRLNAMEKQIRLQTPVSGKQVSYLNEAIRARARALLDKRGIEDAKAVTRLGNAIRRAVLSRYGVASLREIPRHEYGVAMSQIEIWSDALTIRDMVKEARSRAETENSLGVAGQPAGLDDPAAAPGQGD